MKSIRDNIDILCTEYGVEASYAPQIEREVIDSRGYPVARPTKLLIAFRR